jgi:hypothetical protein
LTALFMLDTDSVSCALRGHGQVAANIVRRKPSAIMLAERRQNSGLALTSPHIVDLTRIVILQIC